MHDDDDIIIKDEDDDAPQPRATASSSLTAFSGGQGGLFPAGSSLVWPSSMPSTSVQRLVDRRDDIFAGQRKAYMNIDELEESEMLVDDLFKKQTTRHMKRTYEAWNRFCLLAKVPQFPIAYPLLDLCVAAHYSSAQVCARSFAYQIKQLRHLTEHLWTPFDYVSALDDLDPDGEACFSFVRERRKATRTAAATSADEDLESSDDERAKPASKQDADRNSTRKSADAHKLECPGFPQPHQEFASHEALYSAFLKAVVPVYGVTLRHTWTGDERVHYRCAKYGAGAPSSRCQYYLVGRCDPDTSFWHFDPSTSILEHTHGPDSRIIVDPTWRPAVTSPVIVRALGLDAPSRSKFPLAKRRRSSASSSKLGRKGGTKKTTAFSSSQASRRRLSTSPSPVDNGSLEPGEASSGRRTATAFVSASGSGTSGSRCGTSSSRPSPFVRPAIPARAGTSFQPTARTSVFAPASTSAAPYSPVGPARPDARAPPAPSRALVTADALVGSYLLELEPSGSLQVLVPLFVARGLTTWRTLSELKDPAAARKLCADIIPAASSEVVNALLHFVQLVAR